MPTPFKVRARIEICIDHFYAADEEEAIEALREQLKKSLPESSILQIVINVEDD